MTDKPTIVDLYLWRTRFSPVIQQLEHNCSTVRKDESSLIPSMIPDKKGFCSKINTSARICLQKSLSKDAVNMDVFSEKDSYLIKCYKKSLEKLNYYPSVGRYVNESSSDTSISRRCKKKNTNFRSSNLPDGAFISLAELHSAIRKLKPVNHPSDYLPQNNPKSRVDVPKMEYKMRTPYFVELVSIFPRRSDVPDGAFISLAELETAIQHLRPLKVRSCEDGMSNAKNNRGSRPVITGDMLQEAMSRLKHVDPPLKHVDLPIKHVDPPLTHVDHIVQPPSTSKNNVQANNKQMITKRKKSNAIKSIINPIVTVVDKKRDSNSITHVVNEQPRKRDRCSVIKDHLEEDEPTTSFFSFICCVRVKLSTKK